MSVEAKEQEPALHPGMSYDQLRTALGKLSKMREHWAGLPIPVEETELVIEPKFPYRFGEQPKEDPDYVNGWFSKLLQKDVVIWREKGRVCHYLLPRSRAAMVLHDFGISRVWSVEAEWNAMKKLEELIGTDKFEKYFLCGCFLESSKRSGVTYLFRKGRPTVALSKSGGVVRILCTLCLHPIGYYSGTFVGVMVPTDDVIAHLCMMRGDEPKFWAQANQHDPEDPNSGL